MSRSRVRFTLCLLVCLALSALGAVGAIAAPDPFFPEVGDERYDVRHYDLDLSFDSRRGSIVATAKLKVAARETLSSFALDFGRLHVRGVKVDGKPARYRHGKGKLKITPRRAVSPGRTFTVTVDYMGVPRTDFDHNEFRQGWFATDDGVYTMDEPTGASTWFPNNNTPADKASYTISVSVPRHLVAASNGRLTRVAKRGGRKTFTWTERQPMSSYLAVVNIGRGKLERTTIAGMPSWNFVDLRLVKKARKVLSQLPEIVRFESKVFGPYPFDSSGLILDFSTVTHAALEAQTRPVFASLPTRSIVVHEIAHQWFGDSVGLQSWPDIWLNEGFATWAQWYYDEKHGGPSAAATFRKFLRPPLYNNAALLPAPADLGFAGYLYSPTVYNRGAMTLQALRMKVGTGKMLKVIRRWTSRYRHSNATTLQFMEVAEQVTGRDLDEFFQHWLFEQAKP